MSAQTLLRLARPRRSRINASRLNIPTDHPTGTTPWTVVRVATSSSAGRTVERRPAAHRTATSCLVGPAMTSTSGLPATKANVHRWAGLDAIIFGASDREVAADPATGVRLPTLPFGIPELPQGIPTSAAEIGWRCVGVHQRLGRQRRHHPRRARRTHARRTCEHRRRFIIDNLTAGAVGCDGR